MQPFVSESHSTPAPRGHIWAQFEFGDQIGEDGRYTIVRKLGGGMFSSIWLARDSTRNEFVAAKVLTDHTTSAAERSLFHEAAVLRFISRQPNSYCTSLLDEFKTVDEGSARSHLCFVMPVYGGDARKLVAMRPTPLQLPLAKRIALHLLRGIAHTHGHGFVHTDVKLDNIFFSTTMTADDIEAWMAKEPSQECTLETSQGDMLQAAVSQPLPMISEEEAMRVTYVLADFGCAEPSDLHDNHSIASLALRPPEVYLGAAWDKPVDIWPFGCITFELVTKHYLFRYHPNLKSGLDETENMLYQMMMHTRDLFRAEQLIASPRAPEYFRTDCRLKKDPTLINWPIEALFDELKLEMSDEDATATANLIRRCLELNPGNRPTAAELLNDPWFDGVE